MRAIYEILESLTGSKTTARLIRMIHREDIAARIAEQDRRLDVTITAFQVCSSLSHLEVISESEFGHQPFPGEVCDCSPSWRCQCERK